MNLVDILVDQQIFTKIVDFNPTISYSYMKQDPTIMISLVICIKRTSQKTGIISLIYLLMFIFQCGKLTGFHHRYKRPSVSSEEGKGLMKNMYA